VRAIFTDSTSPGDLAEAVATEVGREVEVVALFTESLGPPGSGADTLIGMLLTNAGLIAGASAGAG
jgi:zinc/manganese transport system substrate-binding protein